MWTPVRGMVLLLLAVGCGTVPATTSLEVQPPAARAVVPVGVTDAEASRPSQPVSVDASAGHRGPEIVELESVSNAGGVLAAPWSDLVATEVNDDGTWTLRSTGVPDHEIDALVAVRSGDGDRLDEVAANPTEPQTPMARPRPISTPAAAQPWPSPSSSTSASVRRPQRAQQPSDPASGSPSVSMAGPRGSTGSKCPKPWCTTRR